TGGQSVNATPPTGGFGTGPGLIITGGGTVELSGNSSYTGDTVVNAGTLQYNGSFAGASTIRLGASSGSAAAGLNSANSSGARYSQTINVRPGSSGVKTVSATNLSAVTTLSGHLALDDNGTIFSTNSRAPLHCTQL